MRNTLLERLHSGFDLDPDAAVALILTHAQGVSWWVADSRLVVGTETGTPLVDISLTSGTLDDVVTALTLGGVTVSYRNPDLAGLHASILIESSGVESHSSGNMIYGHRSVLWAFMGGLSVEVDVAAAQVPLALEQAELHSAGGDWLDYWGGYFKLARTLGQSDADYLDLIVSETLRHRSNKYAIENAIRYATGYVVEIDEPWEWMFVLDKSTLSGADKVKDGVTIGRNLIRPISLVGIDWSVVTPIIERNRAAGVLMLQPITRTSAVIHANISPNLATALTRVPGVIFTVGDVPLLDDMAIEDTGIQNFDVLHLRTNVWWSMVNEGGLAPIATWDPYSTWNSGSWSLQIQITSGHTRSYRFYQDAWRYPSAPWVAYPTWNSESWSSLTIPITSGHASVS